MRSIPALVVVALLSITLLSGSAVAADAGDTAVVDQVGDEYALIFVDSGGQQEGRLVETTDLPAEARHANAVLRRVDGEWRYDEAETERRYEAAQSRFDNLSEDL